jgi:hypothetical protein
MSLHKFAEQVAQHGRGDDSLLVHMTPDEVQRLQAFAEANGTTMTINPDTGLPEAGFLSDLFKSVAPIALGAFLGPAGFGLSSMMAGVATGGITALATGSLSRGLMAGLGAYGGAGLADSFMNAGTSALAGPGLETAMQVPSAEMLGGGAETMSQGDLFNKFLTSDANPATMAKTDVLSAGAKAVAANPLDFAKSNLGNLAYAAAPIAAGAMVPTTTKLDTPKSDNYIRQFDFNINPDTGKPDPLYGVRSMAPVKANEWKDKTFQGQRDLFRQQNPNPYEMGTASLSQPPRMNTGGIVALARGGNVKHYEIGGTVAADLEKAYAAGDYKTVQNLVSANKVSEADIQNQWKGLDTSGLSGLGVNLYNPEAEALFKQAGSWEGADKIRDDAANAANTAMWNKQNQDKWAADAAAATPNGLQYALTHGQTADQYYNTIGNQFNAVTGFGGQYANATDAQIDAAAKEAQRLYGISPADFMKAIEKSGGSLAERYAIGAGNAGLSGLNTNINDWLAKARQDPTFKAKTGLEQQQAALDAMKTVNMNEADVIRATGKTIAELFPSTIKKPIEVVPGGTQLDTATTYDNGAYGNYGSGPATGVDYRGNTVSIATPGDIITNPDGTRTVVPNIPGRPYGGFTGIEQLKSRYTAGGGSLGYTSKAPKNIAEFNQLYNKQTGDSLAAYNYLMGKGGGKYPVKSGADKIAVPYDEYVLGRKPTTLKAATTTSDMVTIGDVKYSLTDPTKQPPADSKGTWQWDLAGKRWVQIASDGTVISGGGGPGSTSGASTSATGNAATDGNTANSISGLAAPADNSISVSDAVASPADSAASTSGDADGGPSGDGTGGEARGGLMPHGRYRLANGGMPSYAMGGGLGSLGSYSDGGRLLKGPGDGVSDSIPATIGAKGQPARLADGEFVIPARIVSELGNGSTDAGAKKLYAMMDRVQKARGKTTGKNKVAANSRADKYLPA